MSAAGLVLRRLHGRLASEGGFTLVEALVAAMLVAIGSLAVLLALDGAQRASFRAEQTQVANDRAQRELEAIKALPYEEIGLTAAPSAAADSSDPRSRVSGSNFLVDPEASTTEELVVEGGSLQGGGTLSGLGVAPGPEPFTSGDISGTIYRFVVWRDDPSCLELVCPGDQDLKRIIVAVALDDTGSGGSRDYVEVQTDAVDPRDSVISDVDAPALGELVVAQQFWLADERCTDSGEPAHSATYTSHSTHGTFGIDCRSTSSGRPNALVTTAPQNPDMLLDYATEVEPGGTDAGLQFQLPSTSECQFKPSGSDGHRQAHIWVSRKLPADFAMTGGATLELWTRTIDGVIAPGELCVTLFTRTEDPAGLLPPTDVRLANLASPGDFYFTKSQNPWPRGDWTPVRIPMSFVPTVIPPNSRLGLQVGLRGGGGSSDDIEVHYDQVQLESRLEVETTTPLTP